MYYLLDKSVQVGQLSHPDSTLKTSDLTVYSPYYSLQLKQK